MTGGRRSYRFANAAQWGCCALDGVDLDPATGNGAVRPHAPWSRPPRRFATPGACLPVFTSSGDLLWTDGQGCLHRLRSGEPEPEAELVPSPFAGTPSHRVVGSAASLWQVGHHGTLRCHDDDTLARVLTVDLEDRATGPSARIVDLAAGTGGGVLVLVEHRDIHRSPGTEIVRIGGGGQRLVPEAGPERKEGAPAALELVGVDSTVAFAWLRRSRRYVVLSGGRRPRLCWFDASGALLFDVPAPGMRPCFAAELLGSDGRDLVFVGGRDGVAGEQPYVVVFDAGGNRVGDLPLAERATGIAASRGTLAVTGAGGLTLFERAATVPAEVPEVRCSVITPALHSPDREDHRRWLRLEATATLPPGTTLELSFAATDDSELRDRLTAIMENERLPSTQRLRALQKEPELRWETTVYHGGAGEPPGAVLLSAPLFDERRRYLWGCATLIAAPGARLPSLASLAVGYPGRSLMEELPAIYRRDEAEPGSFLRALVGVLEATTQGLDDAIAALGQQIHPQTAEGPWLDYVARWLGLPWDDALPSDCKRALALRAEEIAAARGTRRGLELLLETLLPGTPRRFRVTDATADFWFAIAGDDVRPGSALPAMIAGASPRSAELDARAFLGSMRLPCPGRRDDGAWRCSGRVRVEVAARAGERAELEAWLPGLIEAALPLTARLELVWVSARALRGDRLTDELALEAGPVARLGDDAITDLARLPDSRTRIPESGIDLDSRLY